MLGISPWTASTLRALLLLSLLGIQACAPSGGHSRQATVRDSAGVIIVENGGGLRADAQGWRVAPEPSLSIGTLEGAWESQLYQVQGAFRLSDGSIAVGNAGTEEIRIFGQDGGILSVFGGPGAEAGTFRGLTLVARLPGDTLVAVGRQDRRISFFQPREGLLSAHPTDSLFPGPLQAYGRLSDGRLLLQAGYPFDIQSLENGLLRPTQTFFAFHPETGETLEYPAIPGTETLVNRTESSLSVSILPFGRQVAVAASGDHVLLGNGDAYEIRAYARDGSLDRIIRLDQDRVPLTQEDIRRYIDGEADGAGNLELEREIRGELRNVPFPQLLPAFLAFRVDSQGCLWVEEARLPGDEVPVWTVFSPEGEAVARVSLPRGLRLLEVGPDYVLGLLRDEEEVEYVRLYRLERP